VHAVHRRALPDKLGQLHCWQPFPILTWIMWRAFSCTLVQASERFMVVTIKHSGSLVTLSGHGFAAKNSINNAFTAGRLNKWGHAQQVGCSGGLALIGLYPDNLSHKELTAFHIASV